MICDRCKAAADCIRLRFGVARKHPKDCGCPCQHKPKGIHLKSTGGG